MYWMLIVLSISTGQPIKTYGPFDTQMACEAAIRDNYLMISMVQDDYIALYPRVRQNTRCEPRRLDGKPFS